MNLILNNIIILYIDNTGPMRVWVKNEKYPGIAMSRSIGDLIAQTVGVCFKPGKKILF
jgi:hypothetical protein